MAIRCMNPNTIGTETENLFSLTSTTGSELINDFGTTIENLKNHWKGTDAEANLQDLAMVYSGVVTFIKDLQNLIVKVNNNEIIPLQKHIVLSGGTCTVGNELAVTINADPQISIPTGSVESWTDALILDDAANFSEFPTKFERFVSSLEELKDIMLNNWLDGANRAEVVSTFAKFKERVADYINNVNTVRDNLNTVAGIKKQLL